MPGLQDRCLALVRGELDPAAGLKPPVTGQMGDAIALEQRADTPGQLVNHGVLVRDHALDVHADLRIDADLGKLPGGLRVLVRGVQQGLGRDATPVQAGAAQGGFAVLADGLVDAGGLHAELRGPYGRRVAGRPGPDDDDVVAQVHRYNSRRIRAGSSINCFTVTRKRTASRPSMRRWS